MNPAPTTRLAADTAPNAQRMQVVLWRRMPPLEKAQAIARVSRTVRGAIDLAAQLLNVSDLLERALGQVRESS